MAKEYLPLKLDPFRFADNGTRVNGSLPIKNMSRLCPSLASDEGNADIDVHFGVDEQGTRFLRGHMQAQVVLQCQRCMESFTYEIKNDLILGMVHTEEKVDELPESYDPLVIKGNELLIQDVIEDELIVSLPLVSMHEENDCKVVLPLIAESNGISLEKENPFKVIELLRKNPDKK